MTLRALELTSGLKTLFLGQQSSLLHDAGISQEHFARVATCEFEQRLRERYTCFTADSNRHQAVEERREMAHTALEALLSSEVNARRNICYARH